MTVFFILEVSFDLFSNAPVFFQHLILSTYIYSQCFNLSLIIINILFFLRRPLQTVLLRTEGLILMFVIPVTFPHGGFFFPCVFYKSKLWAHFKSWSCIGNQVAWMEDLFFSRVVWCQFLTWGFLGHAGSINLNSKSKWGMVLCLWISWGDIFPFPVRAHACCSGFLFPPCFLPLVNALLFGNSAKHLKGYLL